MLMRRSIAFENLSRTIDPIDDDQNVALVHPSTGTTLFKCELAKLQKANTECANALMVFPPPAAPPPTYAPKPYADHSKSFRRGGYSCRIGGRDRDLPLQPQLPSRLSLRMVTPP